MFQQHINAIYSFAPGMYVRAPQDIDRTDTDFREFRLGQIASIDPIAHVANVRFKHPEQEGVTEEQCSLDNLERCRILADSPFITYKGKKEGKILTHCSNVWVENEFQEYYVLFFGERGTQRLRESEIDVSAVPSTRQDPQPELQLRRYEFQNPKWRSLRDQVIESYNTLRNATFGIEDLVGSRVMLLSHQAEVISHVLGDPDCRYMLADEVGLGKTIEACVIMRGLQRRHPQLKTLIIAPSSLTQQWQNELDSKFWFYFPILRAGKTNAATLRNSAGVIVNVEDLTNDQSLWQLISKIDWGLLIVDEAHQIRKSPTTYELVHHLSRSAQRVLLLTATPIQRFANEYLKLLALMNPHKYDHNDKETFAVMLKAQGKIRRKVVTLAQNLDPDEFDAEEFEEDIEGLVHDLKHDRALRTLVKRFSQSPTQPASEALDILAYISENYRIENRVIRNRRAHLSISLPERQLNTDYSYVPSEEEAAALDALHEYLERYIHAFDFDDLANDLYALMTEYCRILIHASSSSPHALLDVLERRASQVQQQQGVPLPSNVPTNILTFSSPRLEMQRLSQIIALAPMSEDEQNYFDVLLWRTRSWLAQTEQELNRLSSHRGALKTSSSHRLGQVLIALEHSTTTKEKVVAFSTWPQTLTALTPYIRQRYGTGILALFNATLPMEELQEEVNRFQESERCRILLCDELGGEGRNFQIASQIVHIDLPWSPSQLEQRIGRVDRLGRDGIVLSVVPFAKDSLEHDLFRIWQEAFQLFTQSMSGMEIQLEGIQGALGDAIVRNPRTGLTDILPEMVEQATKLRKSVDEERYFEEISVNRQQRSEFERISKDYRDGRKLSAPILNWAELCGLDYDYDPTFDIVAYNPRRFNTVKRQNAKLFDFPNMEEALLRSGRTHELVLRGTFNRSVAVQREKLVFFAPSSDKWTDAIIANALESDRGRCCAIQRRVPGLTNNWEGVELLYSLSIDPRPLYSAGFDPTHLFRALGFLRSTLYRVVVSLDGKVQDKSSNVWKNTAKIPYSDSRGDLHLGRREESHRGIPQMQQFKQQYPPEEWHTLLNGIFTIAEQSLKDEIAFMEDEADIAKAEFARTAAGLQAADLWRKRSSTEVVPTQNSAIDEYEQVSQALVEGICHPQYRLESVCFWRLESTR